MRRGIVLVLVLVVFGALYSEVNAQPVEKFIVSFEAVPRLDHVCFYIEIMNNQDSNDDFPLKLLLNQTSIDIDKVDVTLYEWKRYGYDATVCHECEVDECWLGNVNGTQPGCSKATVMDCDLCGNHTEPREERRWLERQLTSTEKDTGKKELRNQFEEIQIKKQETKRYTLCYDLGEIPVHPDGGWGSYGDVYLDIKDKLYFDFVNSSWWNNNYIYRRLLNITNTDLVNDTINDYTFNFTINTTGDKFQDDGNDTRMVCEDVEIPRTNHTDFNTVSTEIRFNTSTMIILAGAYNDTSCYVYYGNAAATNPDYTWNDTHIVGDEFSGAAVDWEEWVSGDQGSYSVSGGWLTGTKPASSTGAFWTKDSVCGNNTKELFEIRMGFKWVEGHNYILTAGYTNMSWGEKQGAAEYDDGYGDVEQYHLTTGGTPDQIQGESTFNPVSGDEYSLKWVRNGTNSFYVEFFNLSGVQEGNTVSRANMFDHAVLYPAGLSWESGKSIYRNWFYARRWMASPPSITLGTEETQIVPPINTSLLGASFNISDFSFSSSDFVTAFNGTFALTDTTSLVLISSMNMEKISAGGTSAVSIRVSVDGSVILTEEMRTITGSGDIGAVAMTPTRFTGEAGNHNITYEFSRTGTGTITIDNIDAILLQNVSNAGNAVRLNITPAVYSHSATDFVEAFNWTIPKSALSRTYYTIKQTVTKSTSGDSTLSYFFEHLGENHTSPMWQRILSGAIDVGSIAGTHIDVPESGSLNYTIQSRQTDEGDTVSVNGTILDIDMIDSSGNEIPAFQVSNEHTNITDSINIGAGTHNIANATVTIDDGDACFLSMMTSFSSASGSQIPTYFINSSNSSISCTSSKQRSLADGDIGNAVIYLLCENLENGSDYVFNLYVTVAAGETITQIDESFNGFEVTVFNITVINTPPIVAILDPDEDEVVDGESVNINWTTTDLQDDRWLTNVSIHNSTDTINISTQIGDHISNITWNSTTVSDGFYNLTVLSYENETAELLSGDDTILIEVDNIIFPPTVCEVDPILIFEGEIVIGWRFDCP